MEGYPNRFQRMFEISDIERIETFDEVDALKVVEKDGVLCLIGDDFMEEQEEHESSFSYSNRGGENGE